MDYRDFLQAKLVSARPLGFDVPARAVSSQLFDWQRAIVRWALRLGRAALFAECGLGKTPMQLEWARHVAAHTAGRVLVLAPLAVAHQTVTEGEKFGIPTRYCRSQDEADAAGERIVVTNYDMLKAFDPSAFSGVVLDESSILKSYAGKTKREILSAFERTPFKLACTATPAPNDHLELGNHAQFLGAMNSTEMLSRWFINDTMQAGNYRLKRHAAADFWRWATSWAACLSRPSDLGYADDGFHLPELRIHESVVGVDHSRAFAQGRLFVDGTLSATSMWRDKAATAADRCRRGAEIVRAAADDRWVIWCDTNLEADHLTALLPEALEVRGSESVAAKEAKLVAFSEGRAPMIITKPDIAGFGLNWQHCHRQVFVGVSYSFEKLYQALRRSWRFGQTEPVDAHLVIAESEGNILETLRAKQAAHAAMQRAMNAAMRRSGLAKRHERMEQEPYEPRAEMVVPAWLAEKAPNGAMEAR